jgi:MoxR-like ATPase
MSDQHVSPPDPLFVPDIETVLRVAVRHRLVLSYQALAEEVTADAVLEEVLKAVRAPQIDLNRAPVAA